MPDDQVFARSSQLRTSGRVSDTNSLTSCADARSYAMEHWSMLWLCFCFACGMVVFMGFYGSLDVYFARCIPMMAFSRGRRRDVMFQCCLEDSKSEACPAGRKWRQEPQSCLWHVIVLILYIQFAGTAEADMVTSEGRFRELGNPGF